MDRAEEEAIEQKHHQQTKYEHHPSTTTKHGFNDNDEISVIIDTTAGNKDITKEDIPSRRHVHFLMAHHYNDHPADGNGGGGSHDDNNGTWANVLLSGLAPLGQQKSPAVCIWILLIMVLVAISGELLWSKETAGEFLELDPFNVMFGPSIQVLVQSGARYPPCMLNSTHMPPTRRYICINATTAAAMETMPVSLFDPALPPNETTSLVTTPSTCSLQDICGFGGFSNPRTPDQAFRFLTPLFVHSGLLHCAVNLAVLMWMGIKLERLMGSWRFIALYFSTGIFGNVFGANFAPPTTPSSGCSPALFGLLGSLYIDLAFRWKLVHQPLRHFIKLIGYTTLGFVVLDLLPGVDSFSNMGGFLAGLAMGLSTVPAEPLTSKRSFLMLWAARGVTLIIMFILLGVLLNNFYGENGPDEFCTYCQYISCLPINGFCSQQKK